MIADARLPAPEGASARVYGEKRPRVNMPWRAQRIVERSVANAHGVPMRYRVYVNRTATRWWLEVVGGRLQPPQEYGGWLCDYATTTSAKRSEGWVAAIREAP